MSGEGWMGGDLLEQNPLWADHDQRPTTPSYSGEWYKYKYIKIVNTNTKTNTLKSWIQIQIQDSRLSLFVSIVAWKAANTRWGFIVAILSLIMRMIILV